MQDFLLSSLVIVGLTLSLVAGLRKLCPAINGRLLVFGCGTLVGVGLSFLAGVLDARITGAAMLTWWVLLVRGALAASVAFGYANYKQWVLAQLPGAAVTRPAVPVPLVAVEDDPSVEVSAPKPKASPGAALLVLLALASPVAGCAALLPILTGVIAAVSDAIPIIDAIDAFVDRHFSKHEDAVHEIQARNAIARTREELVRSERNARLCEDDPCVDAAWEPFRKEYRGLEATLEASPGVEIVKSYGASADGVPGYKLLMSKGGADLVLRDPLIMAPVTEEP